MTAETIKVIALFLLGACLWVTHLILGQLSIMGKVDWLWLRSTPRSICEHCRCSQVGVDTGDILQDAVLRCRANHNISLPCIILSDDHGVCGLWMAILRLRHDWDWLQSRPDHINGVASLHNEFTARLGLATIAPACRHRRPITAGKYYRTTTTLPGGCRVSVSMDQLMPARSVMRRTER